MPARHASVKRKKTWGGSPIPIRRYSSVLKGRRGRGKPALSCCYITTKAAEKNWLCSLSISNDKRIKTALVYGTVCGRTEAIREGLYQKRIDDSPPLRRARRSFG